MSFCKVKAFSEVYLLLMLLLIGGWNFTYLLYRGKFSLEVKSWLEVYLSVSAMFVYHTKILIITSVISDKCSIIIWLFTFKSTTNNYLIVKNNFCQKFSYKTSPYNTKTTKNSLKKTKNVY